MLDIGCGGGATLQRLLKRSKDAQVYGKFDLVTAVETVYFWPNLPDCLKEVSRVLKQGGKFAMKPSNATIIGVKA